MTTTDGTLREPSPRSPVCRPASPKPAGHRPEEEADCSGGPSGPEIKWEDFTNKDTFWYEIAVLHCCTAATVALLHCCTVALLHCRAAATVTLSRSYLKILHSFALTMKVTSFSRKMDLMARIQTRVFLALLSQRTRTQRNTFSNLQSYIIRMSNSSP